VESWLLHGRSIGVVASFALLYFSATRDDNAVVDTLRLVKNGLIDGGVEGIATHG